MQARNSRWSAVLSVVPVAAVARSLLAALPQPREGNGKGAQRQGRTRPARSMVLDNRPTRPKPKSAHVMRGRLKLAQQMKKQGKAAEARAVLEDVVESYTMA
eukprot:COSAG05_NODE_9470_length_622_cov_0.680688_2_plen_101_part_01